MLTNFTKAFVRNLTNKVTKRLRDTTLSRKSIFKKFEASARKCFRLDLVQCRLYSWGEKDNIFICGNLFQNRCKINKQSTRRTKGRSGRPNILFLHSGFHLRIQILAVSPLILHYAFKKFKPDFWNRDEILKP